MTLTLGPLIVDAADPDTVERFWSAVLGRAACRRLLRFVETDAAKIVKNRVHLDLYVGRIDGLLDAGAVVLAEYLPERVTMADVEGNEFCAFIDPAMDADDRARAFAICTDSARPEELAAWWAPRVGAAVGPGPDGTPRWLSGCSGWEGLVWKFVRVPDERSREERVAPNRWRWSVLGADAGFVDPQGNEVNPGWSAGPGTPSTSDAD